MTVLDLSFDEVLTTTRAVRHRLDIERPVEPEVIRECLGLALQAPSPGSEQNWRFVVVTDPEQRAALAEVYRRGAKASGQDEVLQRLLDEATDERERAHVAGMAESARHFTRTLHEVPVLVIPCHEGRLEHLPPPETAAGWGGILPATWSFMLAARSRGLGTVLTTLHLQFEAEAAEILGLPFEQVMQVGLIPLAYTVGTSFKPAHRKPLDSVLHWDRW